MKPQVLTEIQDLARKKGWLAHHIAEETGLALSVVQRFLSREESPMLLNAEILLEFLRSAPPRKKGKKKKSQ